MSACIQKEVISKHIIKIAFLDEKSVLVQYRTPKVDDEGRITSVSPDENKFKTVIFKTDGQIISLTKESRQFIDDYEIIGESEPHLNGNRNFAALNSQGALIGFV